MNFYTWYCLYKDKDVHVNEVPYDTIAAWDACKKEILKILESKIEHYEVTRNGVRNWIEEIKEL